MAHFGAYDGMRGMFEELNHLAERGLVEEVLDRAGQLLRVARGDDKLELHHYRAWALFELDRIEESLVEARLADDPLDESKALFHLWRFDEAQRSLSDCGDEPEAHWYRALTAEFLGQDPSVFRQRAIAAAPDRFHQPTRLSDEDLDDIVAETLASLPQDLQRLVQEAVIRVQPLPDPHPDVDPLTLGLYIEAGDFPARIEIYRRNIERITNDMEDAQREFRTTLLHEIGHHFGFDEAGVAQLGLE